MLEMEGEIPRFATPEAYEQFALNVEEHAPERAQEARRRAVKLRAHMDGAATDVERELLEAMYAYEWTLFRKHGRRQRASYLRREMKNLGIIKAVDKVVSKGQETSGYPALVAEGMERMLFERVIVKYPHQFTPTAVDKSKQRLRQLGVEDPG
jgi:hypothetical protein